MARIRLTTAYNFQHDDLLHKGKTFLVRIFSSSFLLLLIFLIFCSPEFINQPNRLIIQTSTDLYSGPGKKYKKITKLEAGTQVFLLESQENWHRVELPDGRRGWIYQGAARSVGREKIVIVKDRAKVRRGPGEEYSAFAVILKGKELECVGERGNWYLVELIKGRTGWVSKMDAQKVSFRNLITLKPTYAYRAADKKSGILLNISEGAELIQLGKVREFYQVRLPGGKIGYVHESVVTVVRERSIRVKDRALLRFGSNEGYGVIDTLEVGMQLTKLSQKGDWYEVKTPDGKTGWIHKSSVAVTAADIDEEFVDEKPVYVITNRDSNIREAPGTDKPKITRVKKGTLLLKLDQRNDWIRIKMSDERIGWIYEPLVDYNITVLLTKLDCNLRYGPSTRYQLYRRTQKGTPLVQITERYGWTRVYVDDGNIAWIKGTLHVPLDSLLFANQDCNVRRGPGTQYAKIARIKYGTFVYYVGKEKNWYKIRLIPESEELGEFGYIREDLLNLSGNELMTNERANVRKGPSTDYVRLAQLPPRTRLTKIGEKKDWVHVRYGQGKTGWIFKKLVSYSFSPYPHYRSSGLHYVQDETVAPPVYSDTTPGTNITAETATYEPVTEPGGISEPVVYEPTEKAITKNKRSYWDMSGTTRGENIFGTKEITKVAVNLRTGPDTSASLIKTLPAQTLVTKIAPAGEWWEVMTEDGIYGYIHQVAFGAPETKYLYARTNANIRYGPGTNYQIVGRARVGDVFTRLEKRGRWYYVQYKNGKRGWIREDMVDVQKRITPGPLPQVTPEPAFGMAMTKTNTKLYEGPSQNYPVKRNLSKNTYLKIIGKYGTWSQVRMLNNMDEGWVSNTDILKKFYSRIIVIRDAEVHVTPDLGSGIIGKVKRAQTFRPIDQRNDWFRIALKGQTGWVNLKYVAQLKYPPVYVNQPEVNVRRLPDIKSPKIAILKEGTKLTPIDDEGDWLFVKLPQRRKGWIHKKLVNLQEHPYIIATADANVYERPTAGSMQKGRIRREERYLALDKNPNWYKIPYRTDDVGWVYSGFVKEDIKGSQLIRQRTELRMGPGDDYELLGYVKKGTQAKWLKEVGEWRQIEVSAGLVGWVKSSRTKPLELKKLTAKKLGNAYARPEYNSQIVGRVLKGKTYKPFEKRGTFYRIQLSDGQYAWAPMEYFEGKKKKTVFTVDVAYLKSGPNPQAAVLDTLQPATDLVVLGSYGEYYEVEIKETKKRGYVLKALIFE